MFFLEKRLCYFSQIVYLTICMKCLNLFTENVSAAFAKRVVKVKMEVDWLQELSSAY